MTGNTIQCTLSGTSAQKAQASAGYKFKIATLYGFKAFSSGAGTNNVGNVLIGWNATELPETLTPGGKLTIQLPANTGQDDLNNIWLQGTDGDGVYAVLY